MPNRGESAELDCLRQANEVLAETAHLSLTPWPSDRVIDAWAKRLRSSLLQTTELLGAVLKENSRLRNGRCLVLHRIDDGPWTVYFPTGRAEAERLYRHFATQWTQLMLVRVERDQEDPASPGFPSCPLEGRDMAARKKIKAADAVMIELEEWLTHWRKRPLGTSATLEVHDRLSKAIAAYRELRMGPNV